MKNFLDMKNMSYLVIEAVVQRTEITLKNNSGIIF